MNTKITKGTKGEGFDRGPIWLVHPDEAMCDAFRRRFDGLPGVRLIRGTFEGLGPHDAFVTAGDLVTPSRSGPR
jgi:hypothetical protein